MYIWRHGIICLFLTKEFSDKQIVQHSNAIYVLSHRISFISLPFGLILLSVFIHTCSGCISGLLRLTPQSSVLSPQSLSPSVLSPPPPQSSDTVETGSSISAEPFRTRPPGDVSKAGAPAQLAHLFWSCPDTEWVHHRCAEPFERPAPVERLRGSFFMPAHCGALKRCSCSGRL